MSQVTIFIIFDVLEVLGPPGIDLEWILRNFKNFNFFQFLTNFAKFWITLFSIALQDPDTISSSIFSIHVADFLVHRWSKLNCQIYVNRFDFDSKIAIFEKLVEISGQPVWLKTSQVK